MQSGSKRAWSRSEVAYVLPTLRSGSAVSLSHGISIWATWVTSLPAPRYLRSGAGDNTLRRTLEMEIKCLELRDSMTFIPVICIRPVPENDAQRYLLRRDGYRGDSSEPCIIMIDAQCRGVAYDPYD